MKGWKELEYEVVRDGADVSDEINLTSLPLTLYLAEYYYLLQHGKL